MKGMVITMEKENYTGGAELYPEVILSSNAEDKKGLTQAESFNDSPKIKERQLTEEEKIAVADIEEQINLTDSAAVAGFGAGSQQKVADFSDSALESVRTKNLGEIGDVVTDLMGKLQNFEEDKGGFKIFRRAQSRIENMKAKYGKLETSIDGICEALEEHQLRLTKDIAVLDKLYDVNLANYKELTLYIIAGRNKLKRARENDLAEMLRHAEETGLPEDAQAANDFSSLCDRFDKRLHDLELTRTVALQMAPQIRMIQSNDTVMTEKLQSTLVNTIPLWKSQMVISLGLAHSKSALDAQRAVNDVTNELLRKNAEALKIATVETAKEAERGVVDIDTLKYTNEMLISTLSEVLTIRKEGAERRRNAEIELGKMDEELRTKLLTIE